MAATAYLRRRAAACGARARVVGPGRTLSISTALPYESLLERAEGMSDFTVGLRRELHQHPELMYNEKQTSAVVQRTLDELGVSYSTGWAVNTRQERIPGPGGYGVVADIGSGAPDQPCVALRADMVRIVRVGLDGAGREGGGTSWGWAGRGGGYCRFRPF